MICVNTLKLSPDSLTLKKDDWYYDATVEICPTNATCSDVRWTSSNTSVATVNETTGYISAKAAGTATIRATAQDGSGKSDTISVTVTEDVKVASIELCVDKFAVKVGNTYSLCANIEPINATYRELVWSSSNTSIATVDHNVVRGVSAGTAVITAHATDGSGKCACCTVVVTNTIPADAVDIYETVSYLTNHHPMVIGEYRTLHASVMPDNAHNKNVIWQSSDTSVVTVDETTGRIHKVGYGTATIYAISQSQDWIYDTYVVADSYATISSYEINTHDTSLKVGETTMMITDIVPYYFEEFEATWSSSNPDVATVDPNTGLVTAKTPGTVTISRTIDCSGTNATCTITVHDKERVCVTEDGNNFVVTFENEKSWKSIDIEHMSDSEINVALQHNATQNFSTSDLAFLYLLDPLGVVQFVESNYYRLLFNKVGKYYLAKDEIYYKIFNVKPRLFKVYTFGINYYPYSGTPTPESRVNFLSDAELIFGMHRTPIRDMLIDLAITALRKLIEDLFTSIPGVSQIFQVVDVYQVMFYTVSRCDVPRMVFDQACKYIEDRHEAEMERLKDTELSDLTPEEYQGFKAMKRYRKYLTVIKIAVDVASWLVEWSTMPILADIELGRKISSKAYDSYIVIGDAEINFEQIANSYNPMTS